MTSSLARCSALLAPRLCPLPILVATSQQTRLSCPCIPRWVGRLHLESARALVVTLDDPASADELVAAARRERQDLLIIARAPDAAHAVHLYRLGASDAVPETIEASFQLSEAVLVDVGVPMGTVIASIHKQHEALQDAIGQWSPK